MGKIIYGSELSLKIKEKLKEEVAQIEGRKPTLAVILVGENPASVSYVRSKNKGCVEVGMECRQIDLPDTISQEELLNKIDELNKDDNIDGILVQLPLPKHLDEEEIIQAVDVNKDVDGFNFINAGRLFKGKDSLVPCTPLGVIELLKEMDVDLTGKDVVVVGRSNLVGLPVARLLTKYHATVTLCHSRTKNLKEVCKRADILVAAIGKPRFFNHEYVKEGAYVIDVGINRVDGKLCGDVDFDDVVNHVSAITPVPKGVGPMTVTMLLSNTVKAYKLRGK